MIGQTHAIAIDVPDPSIVEKSELDCSLEYWKRESACTEYSFCLDSGTYR